MTDFSRNLADHNLRHHCTQIIQRRARADLSEREAEIAAAHRGKLADAEAKQAATEAAMVRQASEVESALAELRRTVDGGRQRTESLEAQLAAVSAELEKVQEGNAAVLAERAQLVAKVPRHLLASGEAM